MRRYAFLILSLSFVALSPSSCGPWLLGSIYVPMDVLLLVFYTAVLPPMLTVCPIQPQRIRVRGDENAPIAFPDKTGHQQNKSTSALSALLQNNPTKNGAKRAAFGDVSNTANLLRTNRDDSAAVKNASKVSEKPALLLTEKKPAALAQPAQRPISVAGLRGALNSNADQKPTELPGKQVVNTRKTFNKKDNAVYRDYYLQPSIEAKESTSKEITIEAVQARKEGYASRLLTAPLQQDSSTDYYYADASAAPKQDTVGKEDEAKDDDDDCKVHGEHNVREIYATAPESHEPSRSTKYHHESIALSHPSYDQAHAHSEPEEYWDDDDYENEEDDGYITARSYRSRGDNTTGGATMVLFPKYSNQVKRELALAKEIVEATRTVEDIEDEYWDTSMVAEYNDEIFDFIREQEVGCSDPGYLVYC